MMLQPIPPLLSGESGMHVDISCALAVFLGSIESTATAATSHAEQRFTGDLPCRILGFRIPDPGQRLSTSKPLSFQFADDTTRRFRKWPTVSGPTHNAIAPRFCAPDFTSLTM